MSSSSSDDDDDLDGGSPGNPEGTYSDDTSSYQSQSQVNSGYQNQGAYYPPAS